MIDRGDYVEPTGGMIRLLDVRRYELFCRLLAKADPPDLVGQLGQHIVATGSPTRFRIWIPRILRASRERMLQERAWADELTEDVEELVKEQA